MSVNMGQAVGYLDLDTSKFKSGLKSAISDLKVFKSETATGKDKLAAFSSAAISSGKSLTKGLTVPLAGLGAASVAVTAKFDAGMSKVQAVSGATSSEMEKLRAKAKEMGAQTKFSATESAEAFNYMAMAGWKTEDMLDGIEGIMNLAAASGEDLATTSDIVTDALTAFGLSAKDSTHFADVLAAASSNANTNVSMMGETFKYVGPVAGALGFSVEDVSTAIGLMANSGIKGSQAGTALRNLFTKMAKPTKESAAAMEKLGVSLTDSQGNMRDFQSIMGDLRKGFAGLTQAEKAQTAAALAGQYGMSGLLAIVNASDEDFNKLQDAIYNSEGAAQEMADTMMDNLPGAITLAKSALEGLGIRIGEVITPAITKVVQIFTKFISWLSQASDGVVGFTVALGAILAAIGPVLIVVGTLTRNVLTLIDAYNKLSKVLAGKSVAAFAKSIAAKITDTAATASNTAANIANKLSFSNLGSTVSTAASKILGLAAAHKVAAGAALGIVGVLIGLFVYMKKTGTSVSELKDKIMTVFNNLVKQVPKIVDTVIEVATGIVKNLPKIISTALSKLNVSVRKGLSKLRTALPNVAKWWAKDMPKLISTGADMAVSLINGFSKAAPQLIASGTNVLVQGIDTFFAKAPQLIKAGANMAVTLINGLAKSLPQVAASLMKALPLIVQAVTTIITTLLTTITKNAPAIIKGALKLMTAFISGLVKAQPQIIKAIGTIMLALVKAVLAIVAAMIKAGVQVIQALWRGITSWAGSLRSNVRSLAVSVLNAIKSGLSSLWSVGSNWIRGLYNGITSWFGTIVSRVRSFASGLPSAVRGAIGSLYSAGSDFIQGLWNGMSSKISSVISWAKNKLAGLPSGIKKILGIGSPSWIMHEYGVWFMEGLENGINQGFKPLMRDLNRQVEAILSVYNPLTDYDMTVGMSTDQKLLNALGNISVATQERAQAGGNVITQNITVDGTENPEEFAERLARQLKISMRTV